MNIEIDESAMRITMWSTEMWSTEKFLFCAKKKQTLSSNDQHKRAWEAKTLREAEWEKKMTRKNIRHEYNE